MKDTFFSDAELGSLGIKKYGKNVLISRMTSIYNAEDLSIGDNVRIDDFCILSGGITLASFIHISAYSALFGRSGITMDDFSGLSPRCTIFSASDDFSGESMIGPMVPKEFTKVKTGPVAISKYCQLGAGSIVMPGVTIGEGSVIGAMSFVKRDLAPWGIYCGNPARFLKERKKSLLELSSRL
jgi:acetyltransferase-like isoleucine patch superfamily enzyme